MDTLKLRRKLSHSLEFLPPENQYLLSLLGAGEHPVKASAEIATDENGEVLWVDRYTFARVHGPRETFVKDHVTYEVLASRITYGAHGGALVEHVVKRAG